MQKIVAGGIIVSYLSGYIIKSPAMREYAKKPERVSRTLDSSPKASRQAPVSESFSFEDHRPEMCLGNCLSKTVQRYTYQQLDDRQQMQIDAISENVYGIKAARFEERLGQVSNGHEKAKAAVVTLNKFGRVSDYEQWMGDFLLLCSKPFQEGDERLAEEVDQTYDIPKGHEPVVGDKMYDFTTNPRRLVDKRRLPGGKQIKPFVRDGEIVRDSQYAVENDRIGTLVKGGTSNEALGLFRLAQTRGANAEVLQGIKAFLYGLLLPGQHTYHEIMVAAKDVGMDYVPGREGYRYIDPPITQNDMQLHFPDLFLKPDFLILLSRFFYEDSCEDAESARQAIPADLFPFLDDLKAKFVKLHSDEELQPFRDAGIALVLVEQLREPCFSHLATFINNNELARLRDWRAIENSSMYRELEGIEKATAQLIFSHLVYSTNHPAGGVTTPWLTLIQDTLSEKQAYYPTNPPAFQVGDATKLHKRMRLKRTAYGEYDRGVNLIDTYFEMMSSGISETGELSINEYTSNGFGTWHGLFGHPLNTVEAQGTEPVKRLSTAREGLSCLPVYKGRVYRGTGGPQISDDSVLNKAMRYYSVGNVISHKIFLSASKTIGDSFIVPLDYAFVIDDIKTGHDIQLLSQISREREVLFEPQARFIITRVENDLKKGRAGSRNFNSGNLWIYLREVSSQKTEEERVGRDDEFALAAHEAVESRRFIDKDLYDEAYTSYYSERTPLVEPKHRFGIPPRHPLSPSVVPSKREYEGWKGADTYMQKWLGFPLYVYNIKRMHKSAADPLKVKKGEFRTGGVCAGGGFGPDRLHSKLTFNQYMVLKRNPHITMKDMSFRVKYPFFVQCIITYAPVGNVLKAITDWQKRMQKRFWEIEDIEDASEQRALAIKLAADAQKEFISIHPFEDGNGRTSRLIMDHILMSFGVQPAIVDDPNQDIFSPDWAGEVAKGVQNAEELWDYYTSQSH